jgi:hypothetical protein
VLESEDQSQHYQMLAKSVDQFQQQYMQHLRYQKGVLHIYNIVVHITQRMVQLSTYVSRAKQTMSLALALSGSWPNF